MTQWPGHKPSARSRPTPSGLAYSIPSIALSALLHAILQAYVRLQAKSISPFCNFSVITYVFFFINLVVFFWDWAIRGKQSGPHLSIDPSPTARKLLLFG
jgi:hypothetical protein